jgi:hypothetical protein
VSLVEPPSSTCTLFLIGKNRSGQWVAREQNGLHGGLFISRAAAVRYALFENGHRREAIISCAGPLELDVDGAASDQAESRDARRAA